MKISNILSALASFTATASAATGFVGSNLYYAAGLSTAEQTTLFTGLKDAGVQVLRVWLDGKQLDSRSSEQTLTSSR
jgi:mannan endo-1,4-beta-mannosidase